MNPEIHSQNLMNNLTELTAQMEMEKNENALTVWVVLMIAVSLIAIYFKKRKKDLASSLELALLQNQYK